MVLGYCRPKSHRLVKMKPPFQVVPQLPRTIGKSQLFTLAFGAIVGISWIVLLGEWLNQAGPLGAALAFACGALVNVLVGMCYAELATLLPVSGGEVAYAYRIFGVRTAYVIGWTLALIHIAVISYMSLGAAWIADFLIPGIQGPVLYTFRGGAVHLGSLALAFGSVQGLSYLNYRGLRSATSFQDVLTYGKIAVSILFIAAGFIGGHLANLSPPFRTSTSGVAWRGLISVLVSTLWFYGGFSNIPQVMGEKAAATPLADAGRMILLSIGVAAAFYCLLIISAAMVMPWQELVLKDLPTATAFREAFQSGLFARAVLLAGLFGAFTAANSSVIAGSRILFTLSRAGLVGTRFAAIHPSFGSPVGAITFVSVAASCLVFIGRSGILPIVNVGATCFALAYGVTCIGVIRMRKTQPNQNRPYRLPGGTFTAGLASLCVLWMLILSVYQPYAQAKGSLPLEWMILFVWTLLGLLVWRFARRNREELGEAERGKFLFGESTSVQVQDDRSS